MAGSSVDQMMLTGIAFAEVCAVSMARQKGTNVEIVIPCVFGECFKLSPEVERLVS